MFSGSPLSDPPLGTFACLLAASLRAFVRGRASKPAVFNTNDTNNTYTNNTNNNSNSNNNNNNDMFHNSIKHDVSSPAVCVGWGGASFCSSLGTSGRHEGGAL